MDSFKNLRSAGLPKAVFWLLAAAVLIGAQYYVFVAKREFSSSTKGEDLYAIEAFQHGLPVAHSFVVRGNGLNSVRVQFGRMKAGTVRVRWQLWRGYPDVPDEMSLAFEAEQDLELRAGITWQRFEFPREGNSNKLWYTFQAQLLTPLAEDQRPVQDESTILRASHDNPEQGGALWVGKQRQPGSLVITVTRRAPSLYQQIRSGGAAARRPYWRSPVFLVSAVLAFDFSLLAFVGLALTGGRWGSPVGRAANPGQQSADLDRT